MNKNAVGNLTAQPSSFDDLTGIIHHSTASCTIADAVSHEAIAELIDEVNVVERKDFGPYQVIIGDHPKRGGMAIIVGAESDTCTFIQSRTCHDSMNDDQR